MVGKGSASMKEPEQRHIKIVRVTRMPLPVWKSTRCPTRNTVDSHGRELVRQHRVLFRVSTVAIQAEGISVLCSLVVFIIIPELQDICYLLSRVEPSL